MRGREECGKQLNLFVTEKITRRQCWVPAGKPKPNTLICRCLHKTGRFPEITDQPATELHLISRNISPTHTHHPLLISISLSNLSLAEVGLQPAGLVYLTAVYREPWSMLCTTASERQYGQQLAGSTIGQMDACTHLHSHIQMHTYSLSLSLIHSVALTNCTRDFSLTYYIMAATQTQVCGK